jgi:allene oxide cyclase
MSAKLRIVAAAASVVATVLAVSMVSVASAEPDEVVIHVVERAVTDTVIDTDGDGTLSTGDLLTFHNRIFDATNTQQVGRDQGQCVSINPANGVWQCNYSVFLEDGHIDVQGPFVESRRTTISVIGGTGAYRDVSGIQRLSCGAEGTCDFLFRLIA